MAHFRVCMEVAAGAAAEKRRYTLAITYDELCRKQWNQKATRGDRDFDVNIVSLVKDKDLLERARALYDASSAVSKGTLPASSCLAFCAACLCLQPKQLSLLPSRSTPSQLPRSSLETLTVCACRCLHCCRVVSLWVCPSGGKGKFGKSSWAKGQGKSKNYNSGSSWDKKSYGSRW